jgi:hypothetical protein
MDKDKLLSMRQVIAEFGGLLIRQRQWLTELKKKLHIIDRALLMKELWR